MKTRPNILLIVMDSARAANLSCYGYARPTTPNIDAIAREGTLFEQAISVGCWTLPVHASMFTGLYPISHGLTSSRMALPADCPTLAGHLSQHGYETICFSNNPYISRSTGLANGFETVEELWRITRPRGIKRTPTSRLLKLLEQGRPWTYPAISLIRRGQQVWGRLKRRGAPKRDSGAQLTVKKLKEWLVSRDAAQPFFAFINFMEVHEPYQPPAPYDQKFMPKGISRRAAYRLLANKLSSDPRRAQARQQVLAALYDGELCYLDEQIRQVVDSLESLDLLDDTVLIITSDHGDSLGEHEEFGHRKVLYEQLVRVPLIVRYPARFAADARSSNQVQLVDLYPTLLELAGVRSPAPAGAQSLVGSGRHSGREFAVAENTGTKSAEFVVARMLRTDRYKYIWKSNAEHELYDLDADPAESRNVISHEPAIAAEFEQKLQAWQDSLTRTSVGVESAEYDELVLSRLRELGYVE